MKKIISVVLVLVLVLAFSACSKKESTERKLDSIETSKTMVVYIDPNFPPFEFMGEDGPEGVDVEIAKEIAKELGVNIEFHTANFDSIIMAIKGGKGDIAISGMTITDERKESVDFSDPYINSVQYLITKEDSSLTTIESLAGQNIGVAKGYTGSLLIDDEINLEEGVLNGKGSSFTEYPSAMEATLDLMNDKISCVIMDEYVAKNIVSNNEGLKAVELAYDNGDLAAEEYGVVVAKGNEDLLEIINKVISKLIEEGKIEEWIIQFA